MRVHVCHDRSRDVLSIQERNVRFDDRHPDPVIVALNILDMREEEVHQSPDDLGVAAYYASIFDPNALRAALVAEHMPELLVNRALELAHTARERVVTQTANLDPRRRRMYVTSVEEVASLRKAYRAKYATFYTRLDALIPQVAAATSNRSAPADLVTALRGLRSEYLRASCSEDGTCVREPFVTELTQNLVTVLALGGDALGALAEDRLLAAPETRQRTFAAEIGAAILRAMTVERHEYDLYEKGLEANTPRATLVARYGSPPPVKVDPIDFGSRHVPDAARAAGLGVTNDQRFIETGGLFQSARPAADGQAQILFRDKVSTREIEDCYRTNKVVGATFDTTPPTAFYRGPHTVATLLYETICKVVGTETEVEKRPPIFVPKEETTGLQPGELVSALVDPKTRRGYILQVTRSAPPRADGDPTPSRLVQLRADRLVRFK